MFKVKLIRSALPRHQLVKWAALHHVAGGPFTIRMFAAVPHKCWFNQTPANWELTVYAEGCRRDAILLHSFSLSLSFTRNHLKLYWLWFTCSALFPPMLCLCLSSIITTVLCSGSFCLISLPSIALVFFLFPLYCCMLRYLHASTHLVLLRPLPWTLTEGREARE